MGSVGPQAQSLSLRAGAASAAAAHPSTASGSPAPAIPPSALSGKRSRCRMGAKAEAVGCLMKISFSPPLPPAPAAHRVRPSSLPRASGQGGTMGRARRGKRCTLPLHQPGRVLGPTTLRSPVHRQDIPVGAESAPDWGGGSHRFLSQRWPKTSAEAP